MNRENQETTKRSLERDFGITTEKYLAPGSGLYEYPGQVLIMTRFFHDPGRTDWSTEVKKVVLKGLSEFDQETGTSLLEYEVLGTDFVGSVRVIPEGASFGLPEVMGEAYQFTPQSLYYKKLEDLGKLEYFTGLYESGPGIGLSGLKELLELPKKDRNVQIRYYENLVAVSKDSDGKYYWFRVFSVDSLVHLGGKKYTVSLGTAGPDVKVKYSDPGIAEIISHSGEAKVKFFRLVKGTGPEE